jgi:hypothetical protein
LDYLTVVYYCGSGDLIQGLGLLLGGLGPEDDPTDTFRDTGHGARGYVKLLLRDDGISVYLDNVRGHESRCKIELKGEFWKSASIANFLEFHHFVVSRCSCPPQAPFGFKCTRLDYAWDHCPFSVADVWAACRSGNVRCPGRRRKGWCDFRESLPGDSAAPVLPDDDDDFEDDSGDLCGCTVSIGRKRRGRERQAVFYDGRGFVRAEFRAFQMRSAVIFQKLLLLEVPADQWSGFMLGHLLDFVGFIDRSSDQNISRCGPLSWWSRFVGDAKAARERIVKRVASGAVKLARLVKRSLKSAARLSLIVGPDNFMAAVKDQASRLDHASMGLVNQTRELISRGADFVCPELQLEHGLGSVASLCRRPLVCLDDLRF